jgi:hypothetical protein
MSRNFLPHQFRHRFAKLKLLILLCKWNCFVMTAPRLIYNTVCLALKSLLTLASCSGLVYGEDGDDTLTGPLRRLERFSIAR